MDRLLSELGDVPFSVEPALVRQKSRDFFWYSPILNRQLRGCFAQAVVSPRNEADVARVAAACFRHGVPITARGGGTGNYGQAVPLHGGVVLDMTGLDTIEWQRPGMVRVGPGRKMIDIDRSLSCWELRMHPSTKRTATIRGFVGGGSGGIGSVTWGGLRQPGNVAAARIVTMEAEPRVLELRGNAAQAVNHAYGTTGLITALEMPLAPAWHWIDMIIAFPTFMDAPRFGHAVPLADGIVKKLVSAVAWPIPEAFKSVLVRRGVGGVVTFEQPTVEAPGEVPLYEFTWNHTTLQMLKRDRSVTYLQALHPAERLLDSVAEMADLFGGELVPHLEFLRVGGQVTASGLPIVRFSTEERLREIIAEHRARGVSIADPHVFTLEDGVGHKQVDADQLAFKLGSDPRGLLNPGKMRSFVPQATT